MLRTDPATATRYFSVPAGRLDEKEGTYAQRYAGLFVRDGNYAVCAGCNERKACEGNFRNFVVHLGSCKAVAKFLSPSSQLIRPAKTPGAIAAASGVPDAPLVHQSPGTAVSRFTAPAADITTAFLTDVLVCLICMGKLSINWVASDAAAYLARALLGRSAVTVPHRSTVVRHAHKLFFGYVDIIKDTLAGVSSLSATADGWSDPKLKSYHGLTLHYVDAGWQLRSVNAGLSEIADLEKNRPAIMRTFASQLHRLGISDKLESIVTDSASVNHGAFDVKETLTQVFCVAHALDNAFKRATTSNIGMQAIVKHAQELTTFIRVSGKRRAALKADGVTSVPPAWNPTRFTGAFFALTAILRVLPACLARMRAGGRKNIFIDDAAVDSAEELERCRPEIEAVLPAMERVVVWTQYLSSRTTATISLVSVALDDLKTAVTKCTESAALAIATAPDSRKRTGDQVSKALHAAEARRFLSALTEQLDAYLEPMSSSTLSLLAQALDPRTFHRVADDVPKRDKIYDAFEEMGLVTEEEKKAPRERAVPSAWSQNAGEYLKSVQEVLAMTPDAQRRLDPFQWWSTRTSMPIFQRSVRRILCIPATSADCERLFSLAGMVVTPARSQLSSVNAEVFTLLASWLPTLPQPWKTTVSSGRIQPLSPQALALLRPAMTLSNVRGPPVVPLPDDLEDEEDGEIPELDGDDEDVVLDFSTETAAASAPVSADAGSATA